VIALTVSKLAATLAVVSLACASLLAVEARPAKPTPAKQRPPNIVLIISDDQAWTDYGFMDHPVIRTPHLDKLASESAVFPHGYLPAASCRPSLASIITGLYPHQHGITGNDVAPPAKRPKGWLPQQDPDYMARCEALISKIDKLPTLPRLLATKGYVSHQSGKWWEGHYSRSGFTEGMTHGDSKRGGRCGDDGLKIGREGMQPVFEFIDGAGDKPFFLWYAPFLPHTPHTPPKRLLDKYRAPDRPIELARYYAMCEWFDATCGELLGHIDKRGLADNTVVVYVSDNGWIQLTTGTKVPKGWRTPFAPRSKQSPYDGGVRTPILIRWPGHIEPARHGTLVTSLDIAPTLLSIAGVPKPSEMSGIDLLHACAGRPIQRDAVFGELYAHDIADIDDPSRSLAYRWAVLGKWKLIRHYPGKLGRLAYMLKPREEYPQLYDIVTDPFERRNLANEKPSLVKRLHARMDGVWKPRTE